MVMCVVCMHVSRMHSSFPQVDVPVTRGCIGNNVPPPAGERTQPLYGQLGRVLIFTEALAKEEVRCGFEWSNV